MGIKNAKFHADLISVEKVLKNAPKQVISKNMKEICTIFTFTQVRQTCFAYKFFLMHLKKFYGFEISIKFCVF
jgi:hypothetical protein